FTAGETGPVTVLLASHTDWAGRDGRRLLAHLSRGLARLDNVAEVRSLTQPLGKPLGDEIVPPPPPPGPAGWPGESLAGLFKNVRRNLAGVVGDQTRHAAEQFYLARLPEGAQGPDW